MTTKRRAKKILQNADGHYNDSDHDEALDVIRDLLADMEVRDALISLVVADLRMRADEDGVVNISNFIWEELNRLTSYREKDGR